MPTQLRWMLHPIIGLPSRPFIVWRSTHPGGNPSKQELANELDWEPIEVVGLPVDGDWSDTPYSLDEQGPRDALLDPIRAALRRLEVGAPPIGWTRFDIDGLALPDWEPPDLGAYLEFVLKSRMLRGIHKMLIDTVKASEHYFYLDREEPSRDPSVMPRLILDNTAGFANTGSSSSSEWHPLRLMALSAGSDPYAALALGFGTALNAFGGENDTILMVSVVHQLDPAGPEFELADVVWPFNPLRAPDPPTGLTARLVSHTRPQKLDGPSLDSIGVGWDRPLNPAYAPVRADAPYPVSYVVGCFGPEMWRADLLIQPRPSGIGGWMAYVPSQGVDARPMMFPHHLPRTLTVGNPPAVIPDVTGSDTLTYAVAAQDLFGRWSQWQTVTFQTSTEAPQIPQIFSVKLEHDGRLAVDFGWDWSERSPEFVELAGAYADAPGARILSARFDFKGNAQLVPGASQITPLDKDMKPAASWGAAQDKDPSDPGIRCYRMITMAPLDLTGRSWRDFQVQARGQCWLHQKAIPGFNMGPFGPAVVTRVLNPAPPPQPKAPEAPQWASLPDSAGVSRAVLSWDDVPGVKGYVLYEATETALLSALDGSNPDTSEPFTDRLARLRGANLPSKRDVFRRVHPTLIPPNGGKVFFEATLPRGSRVMHLFAVTAMSENNVESLWPDSSEKFIAVATPRLDVPLPPSLEAEPDPNAAQPTINLRIETSKSVQGGIIEIFRTESDKLAKIPDSMGPPIATLNVDAPVITFADTTVTPGWRRIWYRAVAWSARDDRNGLVEARSPASPPLPILLPPSGLILSDTRVNEPNSTSTEALVSWTTSAPYYLTPLGSHRAVLEARDTTGSLLVRLEGRLDTLTSVQNLAALPGPNPADRCIIRVGQGSNYRLYAWLPRPAASQVFTIVIKIVDPLGRMGIAIVDVPPLEPAAPVIDTIDPDSGRPGDTFTISGGNFILRPGDSVSVHFAIPTEPDAPPDPGPLVIVDAPTATTIVATVPDMPQEGQFHIIVSRSDGAEVFSETKFFVTLL
jgi:hypothetical protein